MKSAGILYKTTIVQRNYSCTNIATCTLLPRNQSFYRQITSQEKDGAVSGVGQW